MTAVVVRRRGEWRPWWVRCRACGTVVQSTGSKQDAQREADQHNTEHHPEPTP